METLAGLRISLQLEWHTVLQFQRADEPAHGAPLLMVNAKTDVFLEQHIAVLVAKEMEGDLTSVLQTD